MTKSDASNVQDLRGLLKKADDEASTAEAALANNKRMSASLQKVLATIDENLAKYDSGWAAFMGSYKAVQEGINRSLAQLEVELPQAKKDKLRAIIEGWKSELTKNEADLGILEGALDHLEIPDLLRSERARLVAERDLSIADQQFKALHMSNLAQRVAAAETKLKKANGIATDSDPQRAEKAMLLWLALEDLGCLQIETEVASATKVFELPPDRNAYEEQLATQGFAYVMAEEKVSTSKAVQLKVADSFKAKKVAYIAKRKARVDELTSLVREKFA